MTLELSRLKPNDYEILDSGAYRIPGKVVGVDSPEFGDAATDYIEMVISTPTGVFLDSFVIARGDECTQYKILDENNQDIFSINPGVFMREKGYFSGEYNIEFNFLREVAGSEQGVLVDRENKIYNGTYFVSNRGLIYKGGETNPDELEKDEFLLREKDYKFYVDENKNYIRLVRLEKCRVVQNIGKKTWQYSENDIYYNLMSERNPIGDLIWVVWQNLI